MERNLFLSRAMLILFVCAAALFSIKPNTEVLSKVTVTYVTFVHDLSNSVADVVDLIIPANAMVITDNSSPQPHVMPEKVVRVIPKNELQCMAENIYHEAATQSYAGKLAVGHVVLNRIKANGYPDTVCGVVYDSCQFSWVCNPHSPIKMNSDYWKQSLAIAKELLTNRETIVDITEGATSFHAGSVRPSWSKTLKLVTTIDQHLFYRMR